jgi:periplasmic protein TonB
MRDGTGILVELAGRAAPRMETDYPSAAARRPETRLLGPAVSIIVHAAILGLLVAAHGLRGEVPTPGPIAVELVVEPSGSPLATPPAPAAAHPTPAPTPIPPADVTHETKRPAPTSPATIVMRKLKPKPRTPESTIAADTPATEPPPAPTPTPTRAPDASGDAGAETPRVAAAAAPAPDAAGGAQGPTRTEESDSARRADYLAAVLAWLERHKEYPEDARRDREEGTALIAFTIDRGGNVLSFDIRRSAGNDALDRAAKEMVRRSNPLPAVPPTYPGARIEMVLPVTFALQ